MEEIKGPDYIKPSWANVHFANLRLWVLLPLLLLFGGTTLVLIQRFHVHEHKNIHHTVVHYQSMLHSGLLNNTRGKQEMLGSLLELLKTNRSVEDALRTQNRSRMLQLVQPWFQQLSSRYHVTHLSFITPERISLLRIHQPQRYGDTVQHATLLNAEQSLQLRSGLEAEPDGRFMLRVVLPWFDSKNRENLLGYSEICMEIEDILHPLSHSLHSPIYIAISKKRLDRIAWENRTHLHGNKPDWDTYSGFVIRAMSHSLVPEDLSHKLFASLDLTGNHAQTLFNHHKRYRIIVAPLLDVANHVIAQVFAVLDVSSQETTAHQAIVKSSLLATALSAILGIFFYILVGRVQLQLRNDEARLSNLVYRDGLTYLFNHKTFQQILENEIIRSRRYGHSVSLIMLDIDHFKHINDTHGHLIGDKILQKLAERLTLQIRNVDSACRYGGEEFTLILPETDSAGATIIAERIRADIEQQIFEFGRQVTLTFTISLGVATFPIDADTAGKLISEADNAMYTAKSAGRNRVMVAMAGEKN